MIDVPLANWKVTRRQKKLVKEVLNSGRLTYGDKTRAFEEGFADAHYRKHGLFTSSGTDALKIALHVLKSRGRWKDGDEVIIPAVTFVATMNVVIMNNLKPVLVDVDVDTVNIDPEKIRAAITKRTRAIIPVHLLGQPADMLAIMEIAKEFNLKVIEDSCETAFVSKDGKTVGSWGDVACFSTYLTHLVTTGVGGMILTNDDDLATEMRSVMFHGRDEAYLNIDDNNKTGSDFTHMVESRFRFPRLGYSDRATEMQAALGLADLEVAHKNIEKRQQNAQYLCGGLIDLVYDGPITLPFERFSQHAFMFFPMLVEDRDALVEHLEMSGIQTRHMMPLTSQPVTLMHIDGNLRKKYPIADYVNKHGLLIGCHPYMKRGDLDYVISVIKEFYQ